MTTKKQPTNQDLLKEIKEVQATLQDHNTRLNAVEYWQMMVKAHEEALKTVRQEERESKGNGNGDSMINKELVKALMIALSAIVSLIALVQVTK